MPAQVVCNKDAIREAYEDVRDDKTGTSWAVFRFEGNEITTGSTGEDYEAFVNEFRGKLSNFKGALFSLSLFKYC